jgi:hypothetical protein
MKKGCLAAEAVKTIQMACVHIVAVMLKYDALLKEIIARHLYHYGVRKKFCLLIFRIA